MWLKSIRSPIVWPQCSAKICPISNKKLEPNSKRVIKANWEPRTKISRYHESMSHENKAGPSCREQNRVARHVQKPGSQLEPNSKRVIKANWEPRTEISRYYESMSHENKAGPSCKGREIIWDLPGPMAIHILQMKYNVKSLLTWLESCGNQSSSRSPEERERRGEGEVLRWK